MHRHGKHSKTPSSNQRDRENQKMPLACLPEGENGKVIRVYGGRGVCMRLAEMGFHPGAIVRMESKHSSRGGGPIAVSVKGTKLGLGRGIARKVVVKPVN